MNKPLSPLENTVRIFLVFAMLAACVHVLLPFLNPLTWAVIIATSFWPVFKKLRKCLNGRGALASFLVIGSLSLCVIVPLVLMGLGLFDAAPKISHWLTSSANYFSLPNYPAWFGKIPVFGKSLAKFWLTAQHDLPSLFGQFKPFIDDFFKWMLRQGVSLGKGVVEVTLALVIAGLLLLSGDRLSATVTRLVVKIGGKEHSDLPSVVAHTVRIITVGVIGTAVAQALLTLIGLLIAGVPGAIVLGFICFVIAVAQLPTLLVWAPPMVWLAMNGHVGMAVFLGLWGLFLVNTIDNFLKPYLISHGAGMPMALIFLGVIGGLLTMGLLGLFIGPTLLGIGYRLLVRWMNTPMDDEEAQVIPATLPPQNTADAAASDVKNLER